MDKAYQIVSAALAWEYSLNLAEGCIHTLYSSDDHRIESLLQMPHHVITHLVGETFSVHPHDLVTALLVDVQTLIWLCRGQFATILSHSVTNSFDFFRREIGLEFREFLEFSCFDLRFEQS